MSAYVFSRVKRHSIKASWMCTQRRPRQLSPDARWRCSRFIGSHEDLEGAPTEGTVILEFPSIEAAKAWYNGSPYREVREHRL